MTRLFVAVDLPRELKEAVAGIFTQLPGARWVPAEQIHLTLRFLGEVDAKEVPIIKQCLERVVFAPFPLVLRGVGHFPPGKYPRVIWVGIDPSPPLLQLYENIQGALAEAGFPPEERRFSPHVTLARLHGTPASATESLEAEHRQFCCPPFNVESFVLYSSVLSRTGAVHTPEAVLKASPAPA
ncbi:RNA 2',3'-cyclic phosphodiesterase [Geomesophilobacter sediminis]|uniref:RNA 2',3'-cyclic phosphodiesterase n=1 Tax=Geomesophilobacter sediminis TaxID=2798584 RepID=A0A8J7J0K9_9BACT|nr:RNA 2',3'-cyclic phosphodiesterase [Geomesophilobacter sediminis]MBJ6726122.1 RNA 2',3'-cyclic phosphodiesterase [Geomesophilobacter sediminis]